VVCLQNYYQEAGLTVAVNRGSLVGTLDPAKEKIDAGGVEAGWESSAEESVLRIRSFWRFDAAIGPDWHIEGEPP